MNIKRFAVPVVLFVCLSFIMSFGCVKEDEFQGGSGPDTSETDDGDGDGVTPDGVEVEGLTVMSVIPKDGVGGYGVNTPIKAIFSMELDAKTVNSDTFKLALGEEPVVGEVSYDSTEKAAIFTPKEPLQMASEYVATLSGDIKDSSNMPFGETYEWSFKTSEPWAYGYGKENDSVRFYVVEQVDDNGFILAGRGSLSNEGILVVKLDSMGIVEWAKDIYTEEDLGEFITAIVQTTDGGYAILGNNGSSPDNDPNWVDISWVMKVSKDGAFEWQKSYAVDKRQILNSLQYASDGGFIVSGIVGDSFETHESDAWVMKLSEDGDIEWQKVFSEYVESKIYEIRQTNDGGFIAAGMTSDSPGGVTTTGEDVWIVKFNPDGSVAWQKVYHKDFTEVVAAIALAPDGGYVVAGYMVDKGAQFNSAYAAKLDSQGNMIWQNTYELPVPTQFNSVEPMVDGGYILKFSLSLPGYGDNIGALKLSESGVVEYLRGYTGNEKNSYMYSSIIPTVDGGFAALIQIAGNPESRLIKMDKDGLLNDGCPQFKDEMATAKIAALALRTFPDITEKNKSAVVKEHTYTASDITIEAQTLCLGIVLPYTRPFVKPGILQKYKPLNETKKAQ